jgi:aryl-alcohol dehydrogenase-like predicted oxidoreductase
MVDGVNTRNTLNRKYLLQAVDGSLRRLQQDFIDLIFCHRPDPNTPIEETVRTMHEIVSSGKALYWGTSEWSADEIIEAFEIAEREHLHRPTMEQPEYSLLRRDRVEKEFAPLYDRLGLGLTTFSPLGAGVLTGKYLNGIPEGSRAAMVASWSPEWKPLVDVLTDPVSNDKVRALKAIADDLGASLAQLSIAWCAANPHVSSVITGASNVSQVNENLKSMEVLEKLAPDVRERVDAIFE